MSCYIVGYGRALPENIVTNAELAPKLGVAPEWIEANSGIKERRWVSASESTSDLASQSLIQAIQNAGLSVDAIDYLIAGTLSPDYQVPGIAPIIQRKLNNAGMIPAVDLRVGCTTILYSLQLAKALIKSKAANIVACVGAEAQSKGLRLDPSSAELSMLFGDGAGAIIVSSNANSYTSSPVLEVKDLVIATDGFFAEDLSVKLPGTANGAEWLSAKNMEKGLQYGAMNGRVVIMHAVRKLSDVASEVLKRNNLSLDQISLIVPHQANVNLLKSLAKRLSFPEEKIIINLDKFGNTSGASAFLALYQAKEENRLIRGKYVLILAFGAGFTWGAALCQVC